MTGKHPLYDIWRGMMTRCYRETNAAYHRYGGRGIRVCKRWHSFRHFVSDMAPRVPGRSIDRIDNDGDYKPSNCRWATAQQQGRNSVSARLITWRGQTRCVAEWAEHLGIVRNTLFMRLRKTTNPDELFAPIPRGSGNPALTPTKVRAIRAAPALRGSGRGLAKKYGVSPALITLVRNRQIWRHV